ncbi:MAG: polyketide synthase dehydratase domain-containing protein [Desulfobacterales bacterium]
MLTEKEAVANVQGSPVHPDVMADFSHSPLGSPFPADAAFHAACAWGQRYAGIVAFPVGLGARHIIRPTRADECYRAGCIPLKYDAQVLVFDIYLHDQKGSLCEVIKDLQMRDISRGAMKVPEWVRV